MFICKEVQKRQRIFLYMKNVAVIDIAATQNPEKQKCVAIQQKRIGEQMYKRKYDDVVEYMQERKMRNIRIIAHAQNRLKNCRVKGTLNTRMVRGKLRYYNRISAKKSVYLSEGDPTIDKLANKDYCERLIRRATEENRWIDDLIIRIPNELPEEIYAKNNKRRELIDPIVQTDEEFINEWLSVSYYRKQINSETAVLTERGDYVRSKSEALIANTLYRLGIPYRYEYPIHLKNGITIFADFTILDVKNRRELIFEHFGMMDMLEYVEEFVRKIKAYGEDGIFIGDRLIVSFENATQRVDIKLIEQQLRLALSTSN